GEIRRREIDVASAEKERRDAAAYPAAGPDLRTLSRETLAERLRPRRLVANIEYQLEKPDFEIADLILGMKAAPYTEGSQPTHEGPAFAKPKFIVGPDDRRRLDTPRFFPGSANAYLSQNCTATMIGPSTPLGAPHCFYQ